MASTYSDLKFELIGTGDQSGVWGTTTNDNIGTAIEQALVGLGNPVFTTDANLTISLTNTVALQTARALVLNATSSGSLTATRELVVPTIEKQYIVQNNTTGGQSITVKTTAGTGITVTNGRKAHLYVDGTNVIQMFDFVDINGGAIDGTPIGAASASTGAFSTLTTSSTVTINGGTANGVAFLNGSKVLTTGSALEFDGTNFGVGTAGNTKNQKSVLYMAGAVAGYFQISNGALGLAATNGLRLGVTAAGLGELYAPTSLASYINNSEGMRLTTTGLGIGISSPTSKLHVSGGRTTLAANGETFALGLQYNSSGGLYYIGATNSATPDMVFSQVGGSERMRITNAGELLVGTTTSLSTRLVSSATNNAFAAINTTAASATAFIWNQATSGNNLFLEFETEGTLTTRGSISYNRAGGLVAYNTTSDYRAKDITGLLTNSGALIDSVPVYMGKMKGATQERPMFIAHETPAYAHTGEKDAVDADGKPVYQQMDASALIPVMWAEIQSLRQRLAAAGI